MDSIRYLKHYKLTMKIGDRKTIDKFAGKTLLIHSIITQSNSNGYKYIGDGSYEVKELVVNILNERKLSQIEIPMNIKFDRLDWHVHNELEIKLTTTDGYINDTYDKSFTLIIEGELIDEENYQK